MRLTVLPVSLFALALAACGSGEAPADDETPIAAATPTPLPTEIPAEYQGRWGLRAADCEAGRATEGLLEVTSNELRFYESVGALESVTAATGGRFRGEFAFTGEGSSWERDVVLDLRNGGSVLVRREFGADVDPAPSNYTRCS